MIDPGPNVASHVRALASAVASADEVVVVLTHGHGDHAGAVDAFVEATGAEVYGPTDVPEVDVVLTDGSVVETDEGALTAVHTPGHTREHLCFHWKARRALFAGDLLLGEGDTTWVAEYPGCVADYLGSLERVRALDLGVIYPTHGPPLQDPAAALDRFERHRRARIRQVEEAMSLYPDADMDALLDMVYGGDLPASVRGAARESLSALVEFVRGDRPASDG